MYPIMYLFGHPVQTYYVCAALAGLTGLILSALLLRRVLPAPGWLVLPLLTAAAALLGARGLNILTNPEAYGSRFSPWTLQYTRLSLMGGLGAGVAAILGYCGMARQRPGRVLDAFVLPAAAGIFLLKLGCFCNGCCFGKPTEGPLGMIFPANAARYEFINSLPLIHAASPRVHPTQLYEMAGCVLALVLAYLLERLTKPAPGGRAAVFAAGFALARWLVLPLRALPYPDIVIRVVYPALYAAVIGGGILLFCRRREDIMDAEGQVKKHARDQDLHRPE